MSIVHGKKDALLFMDTLTGSVTAIADFPSSDAAWIVAYSGISRELTKSGFNVRVAECHEAAALLQHGAQILSDVPRNVFEEKKVSLPENLRKRAAHFFTETERVKQGARLWREGDLERFGQLMNQSCESSITNYESGSEVLIQLHEIVSSTNGVYGSRFSGGGYGGCVLHWQTRPGASCPKRSQVGSLPSTLAASRIFVAETGYLQ
jgi:galactokinase/galacturonokinase